jgi:hypothetical protein
MRKIKILKNKIEIISREGTMEVASLADAFKEFGLDQDRIASEIIEAATEIFKNGNRLIDINEIENAIFDFVDTK